MFRRSVVRWFVSFVLLVSGGVFGLPRLGLTQQDPARRGSIVPKPWGPETLAPPGDAVASRDLPLVDEGAGEGQPGIVAPGGQGGWDSRNPDFGSGPDAAKGFDVPSPGLVVRAKPKPGVRDVDLDKKSGDGLFAVGAAEDPKNAKVAKPAKVKFELLDDGVSKKLGVSGFVFRAQRSDSGRGAAKGRVKVDVSSLAGDYGGEYLARLRLVRFRACVLTTPEKQECQVRTPVESVVGEAGVLEADLDVGDDGDVGISPLGGWGL